jgi:hypothetical protein
MKSREVKYIFLLFLLGGAGSRRPAAVKGAPFSRRGASEPLTARTAVKASSGEEKPLRFMEWNFDRRGGSYDE